MKLTASYVMGTLRSEKVDAALEEINRYLRRLMNRGAGGVDFTAPNSLDLGCTFDPSEQRSFIYAMKEAGWGDVYIRGQFVTFYFPE